MGEEKGKKKRQGVQIKSELARKLLEKVGDGHVTSYINNLIETELLRDEFRNTIAPRLKMLSIEQGKMVIVDMAAGTNTFVYFKEKRAYCERDNSFDCIHVQYALTLPEITRLRVK